MMAYQTMRMKEDRAHRGFCPCVTVCLFVCLYASICMPVRLSLASLSLSTY